MNLSKSRYTIGVTCEKYLWLSCYKKDVAEDVDNEIVFTNGNKVGDLARGLFGNYTLINYNDDYGKMISDTKKELINKPNVICEASFTFDGNFCSVDILKNDIDGVIIYEVKSSTHLKDIYIDDISYQTWVLKKLGLNVKKSYVVYVNSNYIREKDFDINKYFIINDVTDKINLDMVEENIKRLKKVINSNTEPTNDLSISCSKPYSCPFFKYCTRNLIKPNVFDIGWRTSINEKLEYYYKGIISYPDLLNKANLNSKARVQVESYVNNLPAKINKDVIKKLLDSFTYPLYFLDFEAYQEAIPTIIGTKPFQQICFQYSLHYYLERDGVLFHKEFLSSDYNDNPMYKLCQQLCKDIPKNCPVVVYNDSFEKPRLKEMASLYKEFSDHLLNIESNIVDLLPIFRNQEYYVKEMGGGASIKKVLPALFPSDPNCDYNNLKQVHKGDEASEAYLSLKDLNSEDESELRKNMLIYCERDTYAMVKIYERLREVVNEK